jgi:Na+/H+ antiporter NhaA
MHCISRSTTSAGTWIVLASILVGKPVGILSFTALGVAIGLHRPAGVSWRDLIVAGVAAATGFTVALFFATAAFPEGSLPSQLLRGPRPGRDWVCAPRGTDDQASHLTNR